MSRVVPWPRRRSLFVGSLVVSAILVAGHRCAHAADVAAASAPAIEVTTPMPPPDWALLERELLRATSAGCELYFNRYFDDRGYLECVERWGGDDGPDDAIECLADWPLLYALGGSTRVFELYKKGWEGHLRQYTAAKTVDVEMVRDGMYCKEFPVSLDWLHHAEGLTAFINSALADPHDPAFQRRIRRFAGLYLGEEPGVVNYDRQHKIIRSLFNGSRGPLLRKATGLDWAGDPIEVEGRCRPGARRAQLRRDGRALQGLQRHHRRSPAKSVRDESGDGRLHARGMSQNTATGCWNMSMLGSSGCSPTAESFPPTSASTVRSVANVAAAGMAASMVGASRSLRRKPVVPANRNTHHLGLSGFGNATLLSGNTKYADAWRGANRRGQCTVKDRERHDCVPANVWRPGVVRVRPL